MARHKQAYLRIAAFYAGAVLLHVLAIVGWIAIFTGGSLLSKALILFTPPAALLAFALFPRRLRFERDGVPVPAETQPAFNEFLRRAGWLSGLNKPANVRFDMGVRAGAGLDGAWSGLLPRRVIVFGLPAVWVLSVTELACFVARQLSFFSGIDTLLWTWLAETHRAASRLANLAGEHAFGRLVRSAAAGLEHAVAEAMAAEHARAYETAAGVFGADTVDRADRKIDSLAVTFVTYWNEDVAPALAAGLAPPVLAGFDTFLQNAAEREQALAASAGVLLEGAVDDAVRQARTLVRGLPEVEFSLLQQFAGHPLRRSDWSEVATCAYLEQWHADVRRHAAALPEIAPEALAEAASDVTALGSRLLDTDGEKPAGDAREFGEYMLAASLANALAAAGWRFVYTAPGEPRAFRRHGRQLDPFAFVARAVAGEVTVHEWRAWCAEADLTDLRLSA